MESIIESRQMKMDIRMPFPRLQTANRKHTTPWSIILHKKWMSFLTRGCRVGKNKHKLLSLWTKIMFQTVALWLDSETFHLIIYFYLHFFYSHRLLLTTVHFNENGSREQALTKTNELRCKIAFPIQKNGRHYSQEN